MKDLHPDRRLTRALIWEESNQGDHSGMSDEGSLHHGSEDGTVRKRPGRYSCRWCMILMPCRHLAVESGQPVPMQQFLV